MIRTLLRKSSNYFAFCRRLLRDVDPGLWHLRLALKSVLMVIVSIALGLPWLNSAGVVIAALCSVILLLFSQGTTRQEQQITMLIGMVTLVIMLTAGVGLKPYPLLLYGWLIVGCFIAFYMRHFGNRYLLLPIVLVMYLFMGVFPVIDPMRVIVYVTVMMVMAFVLYFYCFPNKVDSQAKHYSLTVFYRYCYLLEQYQYGVEYAWHSQYFNRLLPQLSKVERILKNKAELSVSDDPGHEQLRMLLYAIFRILALILDNLRELTQADQKIFMELRTMVLKVLQATSQVLIELDHVYTHPDQHIVSRQQLLTVYQQAVQHIYDPKQSMGTGLVHYSNLLFGAHRIMELSAKVEEVLRQCRR